MRVCSQLFLLLLGFSSFVVVVRCQVQCHQQSDCSDSGFSSASEGDCCTRALNKDAVGLSFITGGSSGCTPCPLRFGFFESTFSGIERGRGYDIPVGFISGVIPSSSFSVDVNFEHVTTKDTDVEINTNQLDFDGSVDISNVSFSLFVDSVAQEKVEFFNITLDIMSTDLDSYMKETYLNGSVIDSDRLFLFFSQRDYSSFENDPQFLARLVKTKKIANPVTMRVFPLVRSEIISRNLTLLEEFRESEDPRAPQFAAHSDFNTEVISVTFPADENSTGSMITTEAFTVHIVDDNIVEAFRQFYLLVTEITDAVQPDEIDLFAPDMSLTDIALVIIFDDDSLVVGFEQQVYYFDEPDAAISALNIFVTNDTGTELERWLNFVLVLEPATNYSNLTLFVDYVIPVLQRNIRPNIFRVPIAVVLRGDDVFEEDEAVTVRILPDSSSPITARIRVPDANSDVFPVTTVIIRDSEVATIGFERTSYMVGESDGTVEVCVNMTDPPLTAAFIRTGNIVLGIQSANGSADEMDYAALSAITTQLTFEPSAANDSNQRRMCVNVAIRDDQLLESTESFTLSLVSVDASRVELNPNMTEISITDNEALRVGFDPASYTSIESGGFVEFRIIVQGGIFTGEIVVEFYTENGSATAGADYVSTVRNVTFTAGMSSNTVAVPIISDDVLERNETFTGNLRLPSGNTAVVTFAPVTAEATIRDDDNVTIGFINNYMDVEGGNVSVEIEVITGNLGFEVVVSVSTMEDSATDPDDFMMTSELLTFNGNTRRNVVVIALEDDDIVEDPTEAFLAVAALISTDAPRVFINPAVSTITIVDDDEISIALRSPTYQVLESIGSLGVHVVLSGLMTRNVVVNLRSIDGSAVSSGSDPDYASFSRNVTFTPSSSNFQTQIVFLTIVNDGILERTQEQFQVALSLLANDPAVRVTRNISIVTIIDDDAVVIGFDRTSYRVSEQQGSVDVAFQIISGILGFPVAFNFTTFSGSAIAGSDFTSIRRTFSFSRLQTSATVNVPIINDNVYEPEEDFFASLAAQDIPDNVTFVPASTSILIMDNDEISFTFRQEILTITEGTGSAVVFIDRMGSTSVDFSLRLTGALQAETGNRIDRVITFAASDSEISIPFTVINDNVALEPTENLVWTLALDQASDRATVSPYNTTNIHIIDDDELFLSLEIPSSGPESQNATASITFSNEFARDFSINVSSLISENITIAEIATTGADFLDFSSTLVAMAGVNGPLSPITFDVVIVDDQLVEEEQCLPLFIALGQGTGNLLLSIANDTVLYCIEDNDRVSIGFSSPMYFVNENGATVRLFVDVLSGELERAVQVFFSTRDGTATATVPVDYTGVAGAPIQFDAIRRSSILTVPINDDDILENDEFFLGLLNTSDEAVLLSVPRTNVTILESPGDDMVTVGFDPTTYSVNEVDGFVELSVLLLQGTLERDITVQFFTSSGSATEEISRDYTGTTVDLTFTPTQSTSVARVPLINDDILEGQEFFFGNLMNTPNLASASPNRATVTINEDVNDRVTIGFSPSTYTLNETSGSVSFIVQVLNGALETSVQVTVSTEDGTATSSDPADFVALAGEVLEFNATTSSQPVSVRILDDNILENDENFFAFLNSSNGAVILAPGRAMATIQEQPGDDVVTVGFEPVLYFVNEVDQYVTLYAVLLQGTLEREVSLSFQTSPGTATSTAPLDFEATTAVLRFTPAVSRVSVNVSIVNDDRVEDSEYFFGNLRGTAGLVTASPDMANVTITDDSSDRISVGFSPGVYSVNEPDGSIGLNIVRTLNLERRVEVTFFTTDETATSGGLSPDYNGISGLSVVFDPSTVNQSVSVSIINDQVLENLEFFYGNLSSTDRAVEFSVPSAQVSIVEDTAEDAVTVGFQPAVYTVNEVDQFVTLDVVLLQGTLERDVFLSFQTSPGTATSTAPLDFEATTAVLKFTPAVSRVSVNVSIVNDDRVEDSEYFFGNLRGTAELVTASPDMANVTIIEDSSDRISVGFAPNVYSVNEPDGSISLNIVRTLNLERRAEVTFSTTDRTATSGGLMPDYNGISGLSVVFDPSTVNQSVSVSIINDQVLENLEFFYGNLSSTDGAVEFSVPSAQVSIVEDTTDAVVIGFTPQNYSTVEISGVVTLMLQIVQGTLERDVTVPLSTVPGSATQDGATRDYEGVSLILTFSSSTSQRTVDVVLVNDIVVEGNEYFSAVITGSPAVQVGPSTAFVVIADDPDDNVVIGFEPVAYTVAESQGTVNLSVVLLSGTLERPVQVLFSTEEGTATSTDPVDFTGIRNLVLTFDPSTDRHLVMVSIANDNIVEDSEMFSGSLNSSDRAVDLMPETAQVEILSGVMGGDPDKVSIGFDPTSLVVNETDGSIEFTIKVLSGVLESSVIVTFSTSDGSATSSDPADFVPLSNMAVEFNAAIQSQTITVTILNDDILENSENFFGVLATPNTDNVVLDDALAEVTILEQLGDDVVTIGFQPENYTVNEVDGSVRVLVSLISGTLERNVTVRYFTSPGLATETDPRDYQPSASELTFTPSVSQNDLFVVIVNDVLVEGEENFFVNLMGNPGLVQADPNLATVVITEDTTDRVVIGLDRPEYDVVEGSNVTVCARLTAGSLERNVLVTMTSNDGTAIAGADYNRLQVTLTFTPSVSVVCESVSATDDELLEMPEDLEVALDTLDPMVTLNPRTATVNINDNDRVTIGLDQTRYVVNEEDIDRPLSDEFMEVCASVLSGVLSTDVVVELSSQDGSATAPSDFTDFTARLTFTPISSQLCANVSVVNDMVFESQENFSVSLATSSPAVDLQPDRAVIIINDDDRITIGFTRTSDSVREDTPGSILIMARLLSGNIQGRTVTVSYSTVMSSAGGDRMATSGVDFIPASGTFLFSSADTERSFRVTIINDGDTEGAEDFLGQLTTSEDRVDLAPDTTLIQILDDEVITIGFLNTEYDVDEGNGNATLEVGIISGSLQREFVVSFTTFNFSGSNAATEGVDYQAVSMLLTFSSSVLRVEVNVPLTDDGLLESPERFQAQLAEVTAGTSASVNPRLATVVILDNDEVVIGMDRTTVTVNEDVGTEELCASIMSGTLQREVVVPVVFMDRGAKGGLDFVNAAVTLTFSPARNTECFDVRILDDDDYEATEEFFVNLTTSDAQVRLSPHFTVMTIIDLDRVSVGWERPLYPVEEGSGQVELCAVASVSSGGMIQTNLPAINIGFISGSATTPDDYEVPSSLPFFQFERGFPLRQCINISIVPDTVFENATENFFAQLSLAFGSRIDITLRDTEVQITDDERITVGFNPSSYRIIEGTGKVELMVAVISGSLSPGIEVALSLATSDGTAEAGEDYESVVTVLLLNSTTSTVTQLVNIITDNVDEEDEIFRAGLTLDIPNPRIMVAPAMAAVDIVDDNVVRIGFEKTMYVTLENSSVEVCAVVMAPPTLGRQVRVNLATTDDTATSPFDYNSVNTMLTFDPVTSRQCVQVSVAGDLIVETVEKFNVTISSTDDIILSPDVATVEIDEQTTVLISFAEPQYTFAENDGSVSIVVVKSGDTDRPITVRVAGVVQGPDGLRSIPNINTTVTFNPGEFQMNIDVILNDDNVALEPQEMYTVTLSIETGMDLARLSAPDSAVINVLDDDRLTVGFGRPSVNVSESAGTFMMCLVQRGNAARDYDMNFSIVDVTATAGSDYNAAEIPNSVTIKMGETQACFNSSSIIDDMIREPTESFQLQIAAPSNPAITIDQDVTEIFILDDDMTSMTTQVNDTVIGDPLYTVPILVPEDQLQAMNTDSLTLCYEVHGESGHWFNLITDECASVNTRYTAMSNSLNIMDSMAVRAVDDGMNCVNVQVDVQGCSAKVNGVEMDSYSFQGVSVRRYSSKRVRISVPNCQDRTLVMWVMCENNTLQDPDNSSVELTGEMLKFVVMRGLNDNRQAHGLLGQFWNARVSIEPFTGSVLGAVPGDRFVVNITAGSKQRSFTGWLYDLTWDHSEGPCLYVGNRQSGPIGEVLDPNDPVIESLYSNYRVASAFDEGEYQFGMFDDSKC